MKIATPQVIINYAQYLEDHKFYEESFRAFEKGVAVYFIFNELIETDTLLSSIRTRTEMELYIFTHEIVILIRIMFF
jgi:hypothetical protein